MASGCPLVSDFANIAVTSAVRAADRKVELAGDQEHRRRAGDDPDDRRRDQDVDEVVGVEEVRAT